MGFQNGLIVVAVESCCMERVLNKKLFLMHSKKFYWSYKKIDIELVRNFWTELFPSENANLSKAKYLAVTILMKVSLGKKNNFEKAETFHFDFFRMDRSDFLFQNDFSCF